MSGGASCTDQATALRRINEIFGVLIFDMHRLLKIESCNFFNSDVTAYVLSNNDAPPKIFQTQYRYIRGSQLPRGLRHEMSSPA
jgi:hypothetical protein